MIDAMSRRSFLAASAGVSGAVAFCAGAAPLAQPILAAIDHRLDLSELRRLVPLPEQPHIVLGHDIVRLWRVGLSRTLAGGSSITAYTRWDLSLLLADMAREDRLKSQQSHLARSVILTQIGAAPKG